MKLRLASSLVVLLALAHPALGDDKAGTQKSIAELQAAIENVLKETHTPGAAIALVSTDKPEWVAGLGLADVAAHKPVTPQTLFRIGSISKSFAALAALKLQEEGKLNLNDTLAKWAPEIKVMNPWESTDPVRLVNLMEHTAGFADLHLFQYANNNPKPVTLREALAVGADNLVCRWRPGTRMSYCNRGPTLLAYVIEKVTGQRFEDYVRDTFFRPIGMRTASYFLTPDVGATLTKAYALDGIRTYPYWHILDRPAGAINASAEDMAACLRFYLQRGSMDGRRILDAASITRMETPETLPSAKLGATAGYGLYNYASFENGYAFHGHNGGMMGALAEMAYCPELGRGYAIMINTANGSTLWRIGQLMRKYIVRGLKSPALPPAIALSPELRRRYSGTYASISLRNDGILAVGEYFGTLKRVGFDAKGVMLMNPVLAGWPQRWVAVSDRLFRRETDPVPALAFITDTRGRTLLQFDGGTMKKISATQIWLVLGGLSLSTILLMSSLAFTPVWLIRKLLGKLKAPGPLGVRVYPLLGTLVVAAFVFLFGAAQSQLDVMTTLGTPNALSIAIMLVSGAIPLGAILSVAAVWRHRSAPMNRVAYWHSVLVTSALVYMTCFFLYWGFIGVRTWA